MEENYIELLLKLEILEEKIKKIQTEGETNE